ncbi:hypothetical protein Lal_00022141 [Lupinus albus]|nr:hypothetical protein Lal_00022141 [Lupinus albus]
MSLFSLKSCSFYVAEARRMENIPESSSIGTKRRRDEEESGDGKTPSLELDLTFSDTLVALRIMRAHFPHIPKVSVEPFILKSQLYSSVKNRTLVDRELEILRRDKVLRVFKLNTGQDDHAVMFLDDYINQIDRVVKRIEGEKGGGNEVFGWFKTHVLNSKLETGIEHQELCSLLSLGGKVKDSHISLLIKAGIITVKSLSGSIKSQLQSSHILVKTIMSILLNWPSLKILMHGHSNFRLGCLVNLVSFVDLTLKSFDHGIVTKSFVLCCSVCPVKSLALLQIKQGRKEIISLLNRQKYKEMMLASLEKKRLRMSPLDMRFHLRDLIGSGHLRSDQTPTGLIIRVSKD